jgi:hypothetical protein
LFQTGKGFRQKGASLFLTYHYVRNKGTKKESSQTATSMSRTLTNLASRTFRTYNAQLIHITKRANR